MRLVWRLWSGIGILIGRVLSEPLITQIFVMGCDCAAARPPVWTFRPLTPRLRGNDGPRREWKG